jgi:Flp pilus assembly protein TadD
MVIISSTKLQLLVRSILVGTTLACLAGCSETVRKVRPMVTEAPAFAQSGKPGDESSLAQKNPQELVIAGFAYLAAGNASLARLHFVYALKRDPKSSAAYLGLADIDYRSRDYPSALLKYQKAEELQRDNLEAILGQAQVHRQMGKLNLANEQVSRAMKIAPNDIRVLNELAINYDLQGEEKLAAPLYREIALKNPEQAAPFNNIGVNYLSQGRYAEAIVNLSKAYLLDEKDERIRNNLAMAFALYGQENQALKLFTKTLGEAAAWNNLGYLYMTQGHYEDAERALKKALELNPKFYERAQENLDRLEQLRFSATSR